MADKLIYIYIHNDNTNKITLFVDYNQWLNHLDTQNNEITNIPSLCQQKVKIREVDRQRLKKRERRVREIEREGEKERERERESDNSKTVKNIFKFHLPFKYLFMTY